MSEMRARTKCTITRFSLRGGIFLFSIFRSSYCRLVTSEPQQDEDLSGDVEGVVCQQLAAAGVFTSNTRHALARAGENL